MTASTGTPSVSARSSAERTRRCISSSSSAVPTPSRVPRKMAMRVLSSSLGNEGSSGGSRRGEHRDVGLLGLALEAGLGQALGDQLEGALGALDIALQHGECHRALPSTGAPSSFARRARRGVRPRAAHSPGWRCPGWKPRAAFRALIRSRSDPISDCALRYSGWLVPSRDCTSCNLAFGAGEVGLEARDQRILQHFRHVFVAGARPAVAARRCRHAAPGSG